VALQHPDQIVGFAPEGVCGPLGLGCAALMVFLSLGGLVMLR
jgi:hypothetical protein